MDLSQRGFELRKRRARRLLATQSTIFSASETRVRRAVNSNSVGTLLSGRSHSNPDGTSGQWAESFPKPRHGQSPSEKSEKRELGQMPTLHPDSSFLCRDFALRKCRARGLFAIQSRDFSASETQIANCCFVCSLPFLLPPVPASRPRAGRKFRLLCVPNEKRNFFRPLKEDWRPEKNMCGAKWLGGYDFGLRRRGVSADAG
jgi:hypothetical protein